MQKIHSEISPPSPQQLFSLSTLPQELIHLIFHFGEEVHRYSLNKQFLSYTKSFFYLSGKSPSLKKYFILFKKIFEREDLQHQFLPAFQSLGLESIKRFYESEDKKKIALNLLKGNEVFLFKSFCQKCPEAAPSQEEIMVEIPFIFKKSSLASLAYILEEMNLSEVGKGRIFELAIKGESLEMVRYCLEEKAILGEPLNGANLGQVLLPYIDQAVEQKTIPILRYLLNFAKEQGDFRKIFIKAAESGEDVALAILEEYHSFELSEDYFVLALEKDFAVIFKRLLTIAPEMPQRHKETYLNIALRNDSPKLINYLLETFHDQYVIAAPPFNRAQFQFQLLRYILQSSPSADPLSSFKEDLFELVIHQKNLLLPKQLLELVHLAISSNQEAKLIHLIEEYALYRLPKKYLDRMLKSLIKAEFRPALDLLISHRPKILHPDLLNLAIQQEKNRLALFLWQHEELKVNVIDLLRCIMKAKNFSFFKLLLKEPRLQLEGFQDVIVAFILENEQYDLLPLLLKHFSDNEAGFLRHLLDYGLRPSRENLLTYIFELEADFYPALMQLENKKLKKIVRFLLDIPPPSNWKEIKESLEQSSAYQEIDLSNLYEPQFQLRSLSEKIAISPNRLLKALINLNSHLLEQSLSKSDLAQKVSGNVLLFMFKRWPLMSIDDLQSFLLVAETMAKIRQDQKICEKDIYIAYLKKIILAKDNDMLKKLLKKPFSIKMRPVIFKWALFHGYEEVIKIILRSIDEKQNKGFFTGLVLSWGTWFGNLALVKLSLKEGASFSDIQLALKLAFEAGQWKIRKKLLQVLK